jgi:hypothetical protein
MVFGCTRQRVSMDGEYSGKIFDNYLSVVPGDLYTMALTRPRVTCRRYTMHDVEIAVLDIPTAFLGCPLHETLYMRLPECEWPDPYGRARPLVKLNKTLYGIKQANQEYYEEVFDFIVDNLGLQASVAAPGLFFGGNFGEANGVLIPVYFDNIMIIGKSVLVATIAS